MGNTIRLVEFVQADGDKIMINPGEVATIEENKGKVKIRLRSGDTTTVTGTLEEAVDKLEE